MVSFYSQVGLLLYKSPVNSEECETGINTTFFVNCLFFITKGHFSLSSLLLRLASGVGLLTLTATVVDILALYILPDKVRYRKYVYEESPILEMKKEQ